MSQVNALAFIHKVQQDPALKAKLRPLADDDLTGLLKVAADAGFAFDAKDYLEASQALTNTPESTLTDDDLDLIAGGEIGSASAGAGSGKILQQFRIAVTGTCTTAG